MSSVAENFRKQLIEYKSRTYEF